MTSKTFTSILFLLFLSVSLFTCIDTIDFAQADILQNGITVQGKLTKGNPSRIDVQISEVFNFSGVARFIDAKYVDLIDDSGNSVSLNSKIQGIYNLDILPDMAVKIDYGKGYQIKLELNNGAVYESAFDTLYPVSIPTDLTAQKTKEIKPNALGIRDTFNFITFNTSTPFAVYNGQKVNLLWEMESTFKLTDSPGFYRRCPRDCPATNVEQVPKTCFVTLSPTQNYKTLNTSNLSGGEVTNFTILTENASSFIFSEGFYLTVLQQSISADAYNYWSTVAKLTNRSGTIFEAPAGRINSNIRNVSTEKESVFGYFFVTEQRRQRIYIPPILADFPKPVCPVIANPDGSGPGNCCDCLCEPNSSTEQPIWWVE